MATLRFNDSDIGEDRDSSKKKSVDKPVWQEVLSFMPKSLQAKLSMLQEALLNTLEEVRLRPGKPLQIMAGGESYFIHRDTAQSSPYGCEALSLNDVASVLQTISQSSIYALEQEFRNGYLTLPGGHRVGFVGEAVLERGSIKTLKNISSLNIRLSREVRGCAEKVLPYLLETDGGRPFHTIIVSPPCCGKTTLLRDLVRHFSSAINCKGYNVGVVDERSEIASCYRGIPQKDVGLRTDVLDNCPKAEGMLILLWSMSPDILATDELGRSEDVAVVEEVLNAGVTLLATVHGSNMVEVANRPILKKIMQQGIFQRAIILGKSHGPGTITDVLELPSEKSILNKHLRTTHKAITSFSKTSEREG